MITDKDPDDLTLEEIKKNLAYYNRLHYYKVRDAEACEAKMRQQNASNTVRRKRLGKMIKDSGTEMSPDSEETKKQKTGKPRKHNVEDYGLEMPSVVDYLIYLITLHD